MGIHLNDKFLPEHLQRLRKLLQDAKDDPDCDLKPLRQIIREAAEEAPSAHVIRIAETILQCGIDIERGKVSRWN
ncbi:hypothetical protein SH661x_001061 [Planctomicrobium sp. SH661]|uniref:hypothetical protein n=1 Tax=Planctomicrobium sp. SH661 TaxID=3448124 RepID=UPI003F5B603B